MSQTPERVPYNNGQRGNEPAYDLFHPRWPTLRDKLPMPELQKRIFARAGLGFIRAINYVLTNNSQGVPFLSEDEVMQAEYYKFAIGADMMGVNLLDDPELPAERRDWWTVRFDEGARVVAHEFLQDAPDNPIARRILEEGVTAPLEVHQRFHHLIDHAISRFIDRYNPECRYYS